MLRKNYHIAFFIPHLHGGGMERVIVTLIKGMVAKGLQVDLVLVNHGDNRYKDEIPERCRLIDLKAHRTLTAIPNLVNYIKKEKPDILITAMTHINIATLLAKTIYNLSTPIIVTEHNNFSLAHPYSERRFVSKLLPFFMRWLYPKADFIIGVSKGVVDDLKKILGFSLKNLRVIYNPIVDESLLEKAEYGVDHPFYQKGDIPIILAVGRLHIAKDFPTLLRAFSLIQKKMNAHLIILGEGDKRKELEKLSIKLGIEKKVSIPGFVENPYAYMRNSDVFVLSSQWEGLPTVLVEAMACGCPVVSTDCPSGPNEILEGGKYGPLVPPGNPNSLAEKILEILRNPDLARELSIKVRKRSLKFTAERSVEEYLKYIEEAINKD